ncbi:MAG: N-acetylmuramoyl-L-alanine amidase [Planctomycetota bacterium]
MPILYNRFASSRSSEGLSLLRGLCVAALCLAGVGCQLNPGVEHERYGDEILVAGKLIRTGTPVVLWIDSEGYDAYRTNLRFKPYEDAAFEDNVENMSSWASPNRYSLRKDRFHADTPDLTPEQIEQVKEGQWELEELQEVVDQFVIHYDVCGTAQFCFDVLHDHRCLSVHFMLDTDGVIYQTLDVQERAWHAGHANDRSVGIEIAHIGAYPPGHETLDRWYPADADGKVFKDIPEERGAPKTEGFVPRPSSQEPITGAIHGTELVQYDYTDEQYEALIKLTAALNAVLPRIELEAPRDADGNVRMDALSDDEQSTYSGLIGHYHLTTGKIDPGPAFNWDRVISGARKLRN